MKVDKQREAFEAWVKREYPYYTDMSLEWMDQYNEYALDEIQLAFESWEAAQQAQWQPIETAPRDGERILICEPEFITVAYFESGMFQDGERYYDPDYWMPLPPEPNK